MNQSDPWGGLFGEPKKAPSTPESAPTPPAAPAPASSGFPFPSKPAAKSSPFPPKSSAAKPDPFGFGEKSDVSSGKDTSSSSHALDSASVFASMFGGKSAPVAPSVTPPTSKLTPVRSPATPSTPRTRKPAPVVATPRTPLPVRAVPAELPVPIPGFSGSGSELFDAERPVVALSRAQSGLGTLTFELDEGAAQGLYFAVAYETAAGEQRVIVDAAGSDDVVHMIASRRRVGVNLRSISHLDRFLVNVVSISPETVWCGTVSVVTPAGGRLISHLDRSESHETCAQFSGYNVDGRVVLRTESDHKEVPLKRLCEDYGYDRVAWRNDRNPL